MTRSAPARDRILDAAHELVLAQGFSATTVDAVLEAAGASKGAFFHHFPSKRALGQALVERYADGDRAVLEQFMLAAEARSDDSAEQLVEFVRALEVDADEMALSQPGCLFVSFVYEQVPDTHDVRPVIVEAIEVWRRRIADKLALAVAAGRLGDEIDLDSLADHVFTTFEGAFILARATEDAGHVKAQLTHLRRYLELLLGVTASR
jgi:TetR/AcrR family transcriptional repressor of nem operon